MKHKHLDCLMQDLHNISQMIADDILQRSEAAREVQEVLDTMLRDGCDEINAGSHDRNGIPTPEAFREDLAAMLALPGTPFDAVIGPPLSENTCHSNSVLPESWFATRKGSTAASSRSTPPMIRRRVAAIRPMAAR